MQKKIKKKKILTELEEKLRLSQIAFEKRKIKKRKTKERRIKRKRMRR